MTDVLPTSAGQSVEQQQADLRKAKEATAGPVPLIQDAVDTTFDLPRGLFRNTWHVRATVRELTGADEEAMAKVREAVDFYESVIALGTVRIGEIELAEMSLSERQGHLQQLLIGERDMLFLGVTKATYGDRKTLKYRCQFEDCKEEQDLILTLSEDFKPKEVEGLQATSFSFTTTKGQVLTYRPATGGDQVEALRRKGASMAEQNTIMLSRCIREVDGRVVVDPLGFARSLPMRDRQLLLDELMQHQPNIDLVVKIDCVACRREQEVGLGWTDIFRL